MPVSVLPVAFLDTLGGGEIMLVLVVALMLFGGDKLPELARGMGKAMREFKKATGSMQDELKRAMEEVETPTIMPPRSASPEIKSTPGIQPPGTETPAELTEDPALPTGSDPYIDPYIDHDAPLAPDPAPLEPPAEPKPPEQPPSSGPGPVA